MQMINIKIHIPNIKQLMGYRIRDDPYRFVSCGPN